MSDKIKELITEELERAEGIHSPMHTGHEGYGIMLEEIEELIDEISELSDHFDELWDNIKADNVAGQTIWIQELRTRSEKAITEAIQFAAMVERYEKDVLEGK